MSMENDENRNPAPVKPELPADTGFATQDHRTLVGSTNGSPSELPILVPPPPSPGIDLSPSLFTVSVQARIVTVILMQGIGIIALICEAHILWRDIHWNQVLEGDAPVNFPNTKQTWGKKFIAFGEGAEHLRKLLHRDVAQPCICMVVIIILLITNIVTQAFDMKKRHRYRYLSCAAGIYAFLGATLLTAATIQLVLTQEYITNVYGTARKTLSNVIPLDADYLPEELPEGDPIDVRRNAEFFFQVFQSCRDGDVGKWSRKNDLMGFSNRSFKIPSYRQLVQMGFCINKKSVVIPMIIMGALTILAWVNVFLCLKIWRKQIVHLARLEWIDQRVKNKPEGRQHKKFVTFQGMKDCI